ncbi:hypothetical protein CPC08DRAFT_708396, partial [Agrocybe pediades]
LISSHRNPTTSRSSFYLPQPIDCPLPIQKNMDGLLATSDRACDRLFISTQRGQRWNEY